MNISNITNTNHQYFLYLEELNLNDNTLSGGNIWQMA